MTAVEEFQWTKKCNKELTYFLKKIHLIPGKPSKTYPSLKSEWKILLLSDQKRKSIYN